MEVVLQCGDASNANHVVVGCWNTGILDRHPKRLLSSIVAQYALNLRYNQ